MNISDTAANAGITAIGDLANGGTVVIYNGLKPANANTAVTSQVALATATLPADTFGTAAAGVLTANTIAGVPVDAEGTASWYRVFKADGITVVCDGTVGVSGADMIVNQVSFQAGGVVSINSWTLRLPEA